MNCPMDSSRDTHKHSSRLEVKNDRVSDFRGTALLLCCCEETLSKSNFREGFIGLTDRNLPTSKQSQGRN